MKSARQPKVRGIILAGVHAWGESVLERICPRALLPIAGRPLVWYGLDWLRRAGIKKLTICANSDTDALRRCLGDGSKLGTTLDYYEDVMPRGPAGCIRDAALPGDDDTLVVIEATILPDIDLNRVLKAHEESRCALTIVAVQQAVSSGGPRTLEPAGIYILSRSALDLVPEKGYQDIKEMWIPRLYQHGYRAVPHVVEAEAAFRVVGAGGYLQAAGRVLDRLAAREAWGEEYRRTGSAWIHKSAHVSTSARLNGPVLIGPGACVERNAAIMGPTIIGPHSRIATATLLNNVVAWSGCEVGQGAILNHCILLTGSSVEPEVVIRNTVYCREPVQPTYLSPEMAADYWVMYPECRHELPRSRLASASESLLPTPLYGSSSGRLPEQTAPMGPLPSACSSLFSPLSGSTPA